MTSPSRGTIRIAVLCLALFAASVATSGRVSAEQGAPPDRLTPQAMAQIESLLAEKRARSADDRKVDSNLLAERRVRRGLAIASGVRSMATGVDVDPQGRVELELRATIDRDLLQQLARLSVEVIHAEPAYDSVLVRAVLDDVTALAALPQVRFVFPKTPAMTSRRPASGGIPDVRAPRLDSAAARNRLLSRIAPLLTRASGGQVAAVGSVTSQGDATHMAAAARSTYGATGAGVKVGVLSDGVDGLAASQSRGDLGAVTVLSGQAGSGGEGTAMLEIVHDLAPGADLYFATAFSGSASFASNIRALRAAGCDIIVDDVFYFSETPFQDGQVGTTSSNGGIIIQAVKDVVASGALYFSSAGNEGNLSSGTSGTWEGDFVDGGAATIGRGGQLHNFGGGQTYNVLTASTSYGLTLHWSDPLGASTNDYDLFVLDATGTTVVASSTTAQTGSQDPYEYVPGQAVNRRVVIVKYSGAGRFLHLAAIRGRFSIATAGEIHGHAATLSVGAFGVAATPAASPYSFTRPVGPYPGTFNAANRIETFSSDGPRRVFYNSAGTAFTPGNVSATGGTVANKPEITAADGVSTSVSGFTTFYGTSAASPHAAAIAALAKSANPLLSVAQLSAVLTSTAIDIEGAGLDRDSGYGIVMANSAVQAAIALNNAAALTLPDPAIPLTASSATFTWSGVAGAQQYALYLGSTPGAFDIASRYTTGLSLTVTGIPLTSQLLYARFWTQFSGGWLYRDYVYRRISQADQVPYQARLTLPTQVETITSSATRFSWTGPSAADQYSISAGTAAGLSDIATTTTTRLSAVLAGIPMNGNPVYVRLGARVSLTYYYVDYVFQTIDTANAAVLTLPATAVTITATETRFTWDRVPGAEMYWFDVGTSLGGRQLYNASAPNAVVVLTGYALDGLPIYVRLWTLKSGVWRYADYVFQRLHSVLQAVLTSPDPRGALTSSTTAFVWRTLPAADDYWFEVGTGLGVADIYSAETTGVTANVSGIPITGSLVYVRLWSRVSLTWRYVDYAFRTAETANAAVLTAPSPVSSVTDASTRFAWNTVAGAEMYWLDVGTSPGGRDVYAAQGTNFTATVTGYARNGQPLYVRLWTLKAGVWRFVDYVFARADQVTQAVLSLPDRAATISSTSKTFTWNSIAGASSYWLYLGSSLGAPNLFHRQLTGTSLTVTGIQLNGQPLYVRMWTERAGAWTYVDYVFGRANTATQATFNNINSGDTLTTTSFAFTWSAVAGVQSYWLDAGTSLGARDVYNQSAGTATSATINGIVLNSQPLYLRFWTQIAGAWSFVDYIFRR